jgi:hypothetical protein
VGSIVKRDGGLVVPVKTLVKQGRYEVDAHRVAQAIMVRFFGAAAVPGAPSPQNTCSKPKSSPSASRNTAAG